MAKRDHQSCCKKCNAYTGHKSQFCEPCRTVRCDSCSYEFVTNTIIIDEIKCAICRKKDRTQLRKIMRDLL